MDSVSKLSIVATLYKSGPYIKEFVLRSEQIAKKMFGDEYEIILVNDGSPDNSLSIATELLNDSANIKIIDLSRNFGHHRAMMIGLKHAKGDLVYLLDSDLEEEPEWLEPFYHVFKANDCDSVFGVQENRKGSAWEKISGSIFYFIFKKATGLQITSNITVARLMSKRYIKALIRHKERELFFAGLLYITGFNQIPVTVKKHYKGTSSYNFTMKVSQFINGITSFSSLPLIGIFYFGFVISFFSAIMILDILINWVLYKHPPKGWTSIVLSIWLLGGFTISFIGIIGIYLSKIFYEVKRRPYGTVKQIFSNIKK